MALIDVEGGDHLAANMFTAKGWDSNPTFVASGRVRGSCWQLRDTGATTAIAKVLPGTYPTVILGIGVLHNTTALSQHVVQLTGSAGVVALVITDGSGRLTVRNGAGTTIATGTTVIAPNAWYYVELKIVVGAAGSCELHLNGVPGEIPFTVGNFGTANISAVQPICLAVSVVTITSYDDLYVLDTTGSSPQNDFLGDVVVETLFPNADGTHQDWTPNPAGTHFNKVNETIPDGDTTFVSDANPGDIDSYHVSSLAALSGNVYGVVTNLYARKDDATGKQIAPVIREAGADHVGATTGGISTSYLFYRQVWQHDPLGAAWTIANVNGSEYGVKEIL